MKDASRAAADHSVTAEDYRRIFALAREGYCITGAQGLVVEANAAALALLGHRASEIRRLRLIDLVGGDAERHRLASLLDGEPGVPAELPLVRKDGTTVQCEVTAHPRTDERGGYLIGVRDVTEQRRTEQKLVHSAFHDVLTGLPNRLLFIDRLERVLKHAKRYKGYRFAVLFLDLDRFKLVNDTFGHLAGDELLKDVARRLEVCLRAEDSVARFGGDEFAMILDAIHDESDATRVAERIQEALRLPFPLQGRETVVTASIGIALSTSNYESPDDVLHDADAAMYRAKNSGRAHYEIYDLDMHQRAISQRELEADLVTAIERREFAVHYQPVVALDGGSLMGLEALVRWSHPQRGTLLPGEFITVAEQTGTIIEIGWYVLREACRQLKAWRDSYPTTAFRLTMSVNLSTKQFLQPDLLHRIDAILEETGLDPASLRLELTEGVVMQDTDGAREVLSQLRERGIQICLDDFGTGYSSLQRLKQLPLSNVKIDPRFVRDLNANAERKGMVQTIIALGNSLSVDAIAEGVETPEELDELRALGMKFAQGFLFSTPLAPELAERLLAG